LTEDPPASDEDLISRLAEQAREEFEADSGGKPFNEERDDALGSIRMNAQGLARYWRKRREAEGASQGN
jgi:hypothetical protein